MITMMKWLNKHKHLLPEYIVRVMEQSGESTLGKEYSMRMAREQVVWRFPNNWGASLSCSSVTRFTPELAVVHWQSDAEDDNFKLNYTTQLTSDVIPNVTVSELALLLARIRGEAPRES